MNHFLQDAYNDLPDTFHVLLVLIVIDYITGVCLALKEKRISSKIGALPQKCFSCALWRLATLLTRGFWIVEINFLPLQSCSIVQMKSSVFLKM